MFVSKLFSNHIIQGYNLQKRFSSLAPKISQVKLCNQLSGTSSVEVHWKKTKQNPLASTVSHFLDLWLLDNCTEFRDPITTQKISSAAEFLKKSSKNDSIINNVNLIDEHTVEVTWSQPDKSTQQASKFSADFLFENCGSEASSSHLNTVRTPTHVDTPYIDFSELINENQEPNEEGLFKWLQHVDQEGVCVIQNISFSDSSDKAPVQRIAEWIAPLMKTIYADVFDVRSEPQPINIAYTPKALRLHQDMPYYESPPFLQMLHCVNFDEHVKGGESTFLDTFIIAKEFREKHPAAFKTLTKLPCLFQKNHTQRDDPVRLFYRRPHIQVNDRDEFIAMYWSPPFEGPFKGSLQEAEEYYEAYLKLNNLIERLQTSHGIKLRLKNGEMVTFNQRRMLHGRESFSQDGGRHLQGCYIALEPYLNKLQNLRAAYGEYPMDTAGVKFGDSAVPRKGCGSFD